MPTVLHLFANHKITGPAELALETARAIAKRGVHRALFFSSDPRKTKYRDRWLQSLARARGLEEPRGLEGVRLSKHLSPISAFYDVRRLGKWLATSDVDLVHCHLLNDHLLGGIAATRAKKPVVRTLYDGEVPRATRRLRWVLSRHTARLLVLSREVHAALVAAPRDFGLDSAARVLHLDPPIDTARFDPRRVTASRRAALGIADSDFCLGIVARMQPHRRFDALLEAVRRAREEVPELKLVIVGRGTKQDEVAREPVKALGLSDTVVFSGYVDGEDYVATLAAFDAKVFLVPGSDGSCRAVREALALGKPVIAARRGMLPELVRHGETGLVIDDEPAELARAIVDMARDRARREKMSARAREDAEKRFSFDVFASTVERVYADVMEEARAKA